MSTPEGLIQSAICDYLALKKYFFFRSNTTPIFSEGRFRRMGKYAKTGVSDIILVKDGIFHGIEVKRAGGTLSASQKAFKAELEAAGGRYEVVTSIDDVIKCGL